MQTASQPVSQHSNPAQQFVKALYEAATFIFSTRSRTYLDRAQTAEEKNRPTVAAQWLRLAAQFHAKTESEYIWQTYCGCIASHLEASAKATA